MPRRTIFVLQDDPRVRQDLGGYLRRSGWAVAEFDSATDCSRAAMEAPPGCIVSNLPVPGMGCEEFIESLRDIGCGSPVVMVTSETSDDAHRRARAAGVCEILGRDDFSPRLHFVLLMLLGEPGPAPASYDRVWVTL